MKQLVMLEMKKFKMNMIIKYGLMTCGGLLVYLVLFGIFLKQFPTGSVAFFNKIVAMNKIVFTVFIAILIHTMFSEEIYSKSLSISFTYPISRTKLLMAKIVLIVLVGLPFMCGSMALDLLLLYIFNLIFHVTAETVSFGTLLVTFLTGLIQCILAVSAAFIPLYVDVKDASTQTTLVVSGIVAIFLYSAVGSGLFGIEWLFFIVSAALGVLLAKKSLALVVEKDIM